MLGVGESKKENCQRKTGKRIITTMQASRYTKCLDPSSSTPKASNFGAIKPVRTRKMIR
jgi:hypothetical protein